MKIVEPSIKHVQSRSYIRRSSRDDMFYIDLSLLFMSTHVILKFQSVEA